jgi:hypothetical protein
MEAIKNSIIGKKIEKVEYSEVNNHDGPFYFENFDVIDFGINFTMDNGYKWHLNWKDSDNFGLDECAYYFPKHLDRAYLLLWDATARWDQFTKLKIVDFKSDYLDLELTIPQSIEIQFENGKTVTIRIAEEQNLDYSIPDPLAFSDSNDIYVFFSEPPPSPKWIPFKKPSLNETGNKLLDHPTIQVGLYKIIWFLIIFATISICIYLNFKPY